MATVLPPLLPVTGPIVQTVAQRNAVAAYLALTQPDPSYRLRLATGLGLL